MAEGMLAAALGGVLAGLLALPAGCDLPRDPHGTRDEVLGATLRAGVVAPALTPAERAALGLLARQLGAGVEARPGDLHAGLAALDRGEVHLLVGAIPASTPFAEAAAASRPIGREGHVLLLRRGENALLLAANRAIGDAADGADGAPP